MFCTFIIINGRQKWRRRWWCWRYNWINLPPFCRTFYFAVSEVTFRVLSVLCYADHISTALVTLVRNQRPPVIQSGMIRYYCRDRGGIIRGRLFRACFIAYLRHPIMLPLIGLTVSLLCNGLAAIFMQCELLLFQPDIRSSTFHGDLTDAMLIGKPRECPWPMAFRSIWRLQQGARVRQTEGQTDHAMIRSVAIAIALFMTAHKSRDLTQLATAVAL